MNKTLLLCGILFTLVWGLITLMSLGLPIAWCQAMDQATAGFFSKEIMQMANGFYYDTNNNDMPTVAFLILFTLVFIVYLYVINKVESAPVERFSLAIVILFSIILRLITLPGVMIHENDIYRYLWEGKTFRHGVNPYAYAPADLFMAENGYSEDIYDQNNDVIIKGKSFSLEDQNQLQKLIRLRDQNSEYYYRIGHWQVPTIYPPVAQGVFLLSSVIKQDSLYFMKFLFVLFDLGVLGVIIALLRHFHMSPVYSVIYGWSPLVLKEVPNAGHYDSVAIFFTLLGLYLFFRKKEIGSSITMALAALSKLFSFILLPLLLRYVKKSYLGIFLLIVIIFYLPFVFWNQTGWTGVFEGLGTYNQEWAYNGSVFPLVYITLDALVPRLTESYLPTKIITGLMYVAFLGFLYKGRTDDQLAVMHKCFLAIAVLFIASPVGDPWYFCWSIPFLCFFRYRSWLILSGLLMLSYLNFHSDLGLTSMRFLNIPAMNWIIYVPFFLFLLIENLYKPRSVANQGSTKKKAL